MENNLKKCVICSKEESKYKCPCCKDKYCSVDCYKIHKSDFCGKRENIKDSREVYIEQDPNMHRPLNLDEVQDIIVDKSKLNSLKENKSIMNKLKNKKLQKIIKGLDSAKYKKTHLEKMMTDKDFKEFADEILLSLGYLKDNLFTY